MATPANETAANQSRVVEKSVETADAAVERVDLDGADLADRPDDNAGVLPTRPHTTVAETIRAGTERANRAVGAAINAALKRKGLSGADLANRVGAMRGSTLKFPDVWASKRTTGKINLVLPSGDYAPTEELSEIAAALGISVADLLREAYELAGDSHVTFTVPEE